MKTKTLKKLFEQHQHTKPPKGFRAASDDLDVEIFYYDTLIAGYVSTMLTLGATKVDPSEVTRLLNKRGKELEGRLDSSIQLAEQLKNYKHRIDELAGLLLEILADE